MKHELSSLLMEPHIVISPAYGAAYKLDSDGELLVASTLNGGPPTDDEEWGVVGWGMIEDEPETHARIVKSTLHALDSMETMVKFCTRCRKQVHTRVPTRCLPQN